MKRYSFIYPLLVCFSLLTACDKGNDDGNNNTSGQPKLVQSSIAGAQYLCQFGLSDEYPNNAGTYWTVDMDGNSAPISFTDDKGQTITPEEMKIYNINEKYLLIEGIHLDGMAYNDVVLVDKATGAAHNLQIASMYLIVSNYSDRNYTDKNGNIYVTAYGVDGAYKGVVKINTADFTVEQYVSGYAGGMFVDSDGICCFSGVDSGEAIQADNCNLRHPAGQIYSFNELLPDAPGAKYMVLGPDNKTYVVTLLTNADNTTACTIYKVTAGQSTLSAEEVLSQTLQSSSYGKFFYNAIGNTLIFFSSTFTSNTQFVEFDGTTLTATATGTDFLGNTYRAKDALYIYDHYASTNKVVKVGLQFMNVNWFNLKTDQVANPYFLCNKYSTGLMFVGQRISDSKYVFGHIEADGSCVVDGESGNGTSVLNVINMN